MVLSISKKEIDILCSESRSLDFLFKSYWQDVVQHLIDRLTDLQKYAPEERYIRLIQDTDLIQKIPQKYIASYIGVTTSSLSRIKRNIRSKLS